MIDVLVVAVPEEHTEGGLPRHLYDAMMMVVTGSSRVTEPQARTHTHMYTLAHTQHTNTRIHTKAMSHSKSLYSPVEAGCLSATPR